MGKIEKIHDSFFKKVFSDVANVKTFLEIALPEELRKQLDLSEISPESTSYVSGKYKTYLSDLVVKCRTREEAYPVDVYFLLEHKSQPEQTIHLQLLRYKYLSWEQDHDAKQPLRVILSVVFYHGDKRWNIPTRFIELFPIADRLKRFLLDFEYVLFDTNEWDWQAGENRGFQHNVLAFSPLMLMKAAYQQDLEVLRQAFRLWRQMGLLQDKEVINFFMIYIGETRDVTLQQLAEILEESQIKGDEIMPTLAEKLRAEGKREGKKEGSLLEKQNILMMLLSTRFHLQESEKHLIHSIRDTKKLDRAIKMVVTAEEKMEILSVL